MGLPTIAVPQYTLTVPSTEKQVNYRPFLVKEEKILLIAMESDDQQQMTNAIQTIIQNCVYEDLDVNSMPMFDIEYIFLQLRAKSKGEIVDLSYECEKCKKQIPTKVDLTTIEVTRTEGHTNKIPLSEDVGVMMKYPSISMQDSISTDNTDVENVFLTVTACIDSIWDKDSVFSSKDHTKDELDKFVESLPDASFAKIQKFFDTVPVLRHDIEVKCLNKNGKGKKASTCGHTETRTLEGLASFFA
jgi:hypothetical protein